MTSLLMSSPQIYISHRLFRCRKSNSRDVIAISPSFSRTASRAPRRACSQATFDPVKSHFLGVFLMASEGLSRKEGGRDNHYCSETIFVKLPIFKRPRPHELEIFKSAYFVTRIRVDEALNYSGERLKKMWFQWVQSTPFIADTVGTSRWCPH